MWFPVWMFLPSTSSSWILLLLSARFKSPLLSALSNVGYLHTRTRSSVTLLVDNLNKLISSSHKGGFPDFPSILAVLLWAFLFFTVGTPYSNSSVTNVICNWMSPPFSSSIFLHLKIYILATAPPCKLTFSWLCLRTHQTFSVTEFMENRKDTESS